MIHWTEMAEDIGRSRGDGTHGQEVLRLGQRNHPASEYYGSVDFLIRYSYSLMSSELGSQLIRILRIS